MRGVMKTGRGQGLVELQDVPVPVLGPGEVLIRVHVAAICGTDLHIYYDEHPYWPPVILGHEFAGTVEAVGADVDGYQPGARVVSETSTGSCGVCFLCRGGNRHICAHKRAIGIGRHGALTEYITMPAGLLHQIPDGLTFEEASMTEPTAISVHAVVERAAVRPGESVVIVGPGPIGLLCLQVAKARGASPIIVSGTKRSAAVRLPLARQLGADATVTAGEDDLVERVMEMTEGRGADVVIETSGAPAAVEMLPRLVRRLGRICQVGVMGQPRISFPWDEALFKGAEIQFSFSSRSTSWATALQLLASGKVRTAPLISARLPLELWRDAFEAQEQGKAVKALLFPGGVP